MGFQEAVRTVFIEKYANFEGRASRSEYWWSYLGMLIAVGVFFVLASILPQSLAAVIGILIMILALAAMVPQIAVTVRRLHDRDMSGWWILIAFVPVAGIALLVFMCLQGTDGPNSFGADPLRPNASAHVFR